MSEPVMCPGLISEYFDQELEVIHWNTWRVDISSPRLVVILISRLTYHIIESASSG